MNIGQNIKNNQVAWGIGVGGVAFAGFIVGVIWQVSTPFETSSKSKPATEEKVSTDSQPSSEQKNTSDATREQKKVQRLNGTILKKDAQSKTITVQVKNRTKSDPFNTVTVDISDSTNINLFLRNKQRIQPDTANKKFNVQQISFSKLRKEDDIIIEFAESVESSNPQGTAQTIKVRGY